MLEVKRPDYVATTHCREDGNGYPVTGGLRAGAGQRLRCSRIFAMSVEGSRDCMVQLP
jgi:hypothetical protein